jgi:hypothetical protein
MPSDWYSAGTSGRRPPSPQARAQVDWAIAYIRDRYGRPAWWRRLWMRLARCRRPFGRPAC